MGKRIDHMAVEIYVSGPQVDKLQTAFDPSGDNPDVTVLFMDRSTTHDANGTYNGDGCDRLEIKDGVLWAAIDGLEGEAATRIAEEVKARADENPELRYMVVGAREEDDVETYDVLFLRGFDANDNPMKRLHGRFYEDFVVNGI